MQILTAHFQRKKNEFIYFFQTIVKVVEKLSYDIERQIDQQYIQASQQLDGLIPLQIQDACLKMEQERIKIYDSMVDRLCLSLKNFALSMSQKSQSDRRPSLFASAPKNEFHHRRVPSIQPFNVEDEKSPSRKEIRNDDNNQTPQPMVNNIETQVIQTQIKKRNQSSIYVRAPSPFTQRAKANRMESSQKRVSDYKQVKERSKSKQKLQVLKKNDICQSLDNYFIKEAKQMLQKSQNRGLKSSPYNSQRRNIMVNSLTSPFQNDEVIIDSGKNLQSIIENKFAKLQQINVPKETTKFYNTNLISPIQRFKID